MAAMQSYDEEDRSQPVVVAQVLAVSAKRQPRGSGHLISQMGQLEYRTDMVLYQLLIRDHVTILGILVL